MNECENHMEGAVLLSVLVKVGVRGALGNTFFYL